MNMKLKTCGSEECSACETEPCWVCSACKSKKRCKERYCRKYAQLLAARSRSERKCNKCHRTFSSHGSLSHHEAKSGCGRLAKKWGNLPHKCLMCIETPLFTNHEDLIVHTNTTHKGKIRYSVRCPNIMTCDKFIKPNNILRHYAGQGVSQNNTQNTN